MIFSRRVKLVDYTTYVIHSASMHHVLARRDVRDQQEMLGEVPRERVREKGYREGSESQVCISGVEVVAVRTSVAV